MKSIQCSVTYCIYWYSLKKPGFYTDIDNIVYIGKQYGKLPNIYNLNYKHYKDKPKKEKKQKPMPP